MADRQDEAGAQDAFARASALRPDTDETLAARALFLESRRRWAEARELQLRLLARQPDSPEVLSALARLSLAEGELDVASAHVQKLRALASAAAGAGEDEKRELAGALFRVAVPLLGAHHPAEAEGPTTGRWRSKSEAGIARPPRRSSRSSARWSRRGGLARPRSPPWRKVPGSWLRIRPSSCSTSASRLLCPGAAPERPGRRPGG